MGGCQGRYCASLLAAAARRPDRELDELAWFAPAAPIKPVEVAAIAGS